MPRREETAPTPSVLGAEAPSIDILRDAINQQVSRFQPSEIVLIVRDGAREKAVEASLGIGSYFPGKEGLSVTSARKFKGLESPCVIVEANLDWPDELLITALTRATEELTLVFEKDEMGQVISRFIK